jgi:AraC-like DNA-binding protein
MHVLIIDDDLGTCETLSVGLRTLGGHEVTTALRGQQGLALAAASSYDIAIIDQRLADMNGLDLLTALRNTRSAGATAYILTAYGSIEDAVIAMKRGAADYLQKQHCDIIELNRLLAGPPVPKSPRDRRIAKVITLLAQRPTLTMAELATAVDLSESRLRHVFLEEAGVSFGIYQRELRLTRAALLLRLSSRTIRQIALDFGWSNLGSFDTAFSARFGCTPTEYRSAIHAHE